jgi:hypothetical protein
MALIRLHVRVDPAFVEAEAADHPPGMTPQRSVEIGVALELGYVPPRVTGASCLLVVEDPTDPGAFTLLATRPPPSPSPHVQILSSEPVEDPPPIAKANLPHLDEGLLADEARAVALALLKDVDPDRLDGMASTFSPDLPHVAALLHARARLEHARRRGGQDHHDALRAFQGRVSDRAQTSLSHLRKGVTRAGVPLRAPDESDHAARIVEALREATLDLGPAAASSWDKYGGAIELALEEDPPRVSASAISDQPAIEIPRNVVDAEVGLDAALSVPGAASMSTSDLADAIGICPVVAQAVLASVVPLGGGVVLVRQGYPKALFANRPPPSSAAIKLAASTVRPRAQHLADPDQIPGTFAALRRAGPYDPPSAQVERAKRACGRRAWVTWYTTAERAGILGDVR